MSAVRPKVLIIDDNPANLQTLGRALASDYDLYVATSGINGLKLTREIHPDIILLDVMMPEMDGYEVCRRLKADPELRSIPVVFVTALSDVDAEAKGLQLGAIDYLTKPINVNLARHRIHNLILMNGLRREVQTQRDHLERQRRRLNDVLEGSNTGTWEWNVQTGETGFNERWAEIIGYSLDELNPVSIDTWIERVHPDDLKLSRTLFERHFSGQLPFYDCEMRMRHKNGHWVWVADRGKVVTWTEQGQPLLMSGTRQDISARKEAEGHLRMAATVFSHAREGILITDREGVILDVNAAFSFITGFGAEEVLGQRPNILKSGKHDDAFYTAMWRDLLENGFWYGEVWNRRKNGNLFVELLTISSVRDEHGNIQNFIGLFSDITLLKEHERQLERIAHYDSLTGLANRVLLSDRLSQAMIQTHRRERLLAVAYLDLDGFKAVNDTHGHEVGDQLLATVARNMKRVLRDGDTLARIGGDEFVAVLADLPSVDDCVPLLSRLLDTAAQPVRVGDALLTISASLGVTFYPEVDEVDADQLLRQADQAMYQAKQAGRNRFHIFDTEHARNVRNRHESLGRIKQALDDQEFELYFQPKVNMRTGQIIGAEALLRWHHPQRGLLAPGEFLPVIEGHPLSIDLGEWVIDTALAQIVAWCVTGRGLQVSVNVGARQLQHPRFVSRLRMLLARYPEVRPGTLELEILETSALEDVTLVSQVMRDCQEMGVSFALDDFGTGYSSLTYLKRLRARLLKIDQSFVRDMLDDPDDLAVLEGVLHLATVFRRKAIAEGVETIAHGEMLLRMGCEWAQGYAIARPMPAQDFQHWLDSWDAPPSWKNIGPSKRDHLPTLFETVEQRAWIATVINYLTGHSDMLPEQALQDYRISHWLDHPGGIVTVDGEGHAVDVLHQQIDSLTRELLALKRQGHVDQVKARIAELQGLSDELLQRLKSLA